MKTLIVDEIIEMADTTELRIFPSPYLRAERLKYIGRMILPENWF
jgi:hypothetical protein